MGSGARVKTIRNYIAEPNDAIQAAIDASLAPYPDTLEVSELIDAAVTNQSLVTVVAGDVQGAVDRAVALGAKGIIIPKGTTSIISATVNLPSSISQVVVDGDLICNANVPVFTRSGSVTDTAATSITAGISKGDRTVTATWSNVSIGDWVFVVSADTLPGTTDKLGYMRQIVTLPNPTSVTLDTAIPRDMPASNRRYRTIGLASPLFITGIGSISYSGAITGAGGNTATMLQFTWCKDIRITNLTLRDGGGRCVELRHCIGAVVDCRIDNFTDDIGNGHVGYGVDVSGGSRNVLVMGHISRCRHACTTNVGPNLTQFVNYGEPENLRFEPVTYECGDKALDTHRAGWGIRMILSDMGSGGGVQIRADNCYVEGISSGSYTGTALVVQENLVVPPTIGPLKISNCSADAIQLNGYAKFIAPPDFYNVAGNQIVYGAGVSTSLVNYATSGSIGGSALAAGAAAKATVSVTGAAVGMYVTVTPNTYPGDGVTWSGYVSATDTVTVVVTAVVAKTPTASTYNVRVSPQL